MGAVVGVAVSQEGMEEEEAVVEVVGVVGIVEVVEVVEEEEDMAVGEVEEAAMEANKKR